MAAILLLAYGSLRPATRPSAWTLGPTRHGPLPASMPGGQPRSESVRNLGEGDQRPFARPVSMSADADCATPIRDANSASVGDEVEGSRCATPLHRRQNIPRPGQSRVLFDIVSAGRVAPGATASRASLRSVRSGRPFGSPLTPSRQVLGDGQAGGRSRLRSNRIVIDPATSCRMVVEGLCRPGFGLVAG